MKKLTWLKAVLAVGLLVSLSGPAALAAAGVGHLPLDRWYSPSRGDNFTTADPRWTGSVGDRRAPDYRLSRRAGYILPPDTPVRDGLVPLHSWWSPSRGDNVITSHPSWRGSPGETRSPDYVYVRHEGYAFAEPVAGTIPLFSWYSGSRGDNAALTHWSWWSDGRPGDQRSPDYGHVRVEGWIPPPSEEGEPDLAAVFGYDRRPADRRPGVLLVLEAFADQPFPVAARTITERFFGPGRQSVKKILTTASAGKTSIVPGGVVSVTQSYPIGAVTPPNAAVSERHDDANALQLADAEFDFRTLDVDGDGALRADEAIIIKLVADDCACGQQRGAPNLTLDGVSIGGAAFAAICQNAHWHVLAEEIGHTLGFWDLYGVNASRNRRASFMADNCGTTIDSAVGPFLLDPWHGMTAGWLEPRPIPMSPAGGSAVIRVADSVFESTPAASRPVLLYDPQRGLDEYFLLQHRSPNGPSGVDTGVINEGLAVWYTNVHEGDPLRLEKFDWPPPVTSQNSNTGDTNAHLYLAADGSVGQGGFVRAGETVDLRWGANDESSGITVKVFRTSAAEAEVMWWDEERGFKPRLDLAARDGNRLWLEGVFPPPNGPAVRLDFRTPQRADSITLQRRGRGGESRFVVSAPGWVQDLPPGTDVDVRVSLADLPSSEGNWMRLGDG